MRTGLFGPILGLTLVATALTGCTSLPKPSPEWNVRYPVDTQNTTWARTVAPAAAEHPGASEIQLLPFGLDALSARLALADTAERTLDVQYYIWTPDATGQLLTDRLLCAADRGVRVRLLLDDFGGSASDEVLLALDSHTNVEVRLFNPVANRTFRRLSTLFEFQRINRRMHNKSFTADGLVTILGGRNVGARYYAAGDEPHFADFDVMAAGPAAAEVSEMFERYWFSSLSIPIHALTKNRLSPEQVSQRYAGLAARVQAITNTPDFQGLAGNEVGEEIRQHELDATWGKTRLVCDQPEKITTDLTNTATHLLPQLRHVLDGTTREVFIVSPYFVPGPTGVELFRSLRARGIRVVVLSNSLAATDVVAVHAGYRRYRKALLRAGVELWEIKPNARLRATALEDRTTRRRNAKSPRSSLHAKSFIFDRQTLFVGSLNVDPRSTVLNTEMGLVIEIPDVAGPVADSLEARLKEAAYRLEFVPGPGPCKECGSIVWIGQENGREVRYTHEPHASLYRRLVVNLLSLLPIESQL
ncbi:MAG TPA: phospholipase D family protein [Candidatus Acidoferrum sp.]|nr:phospholipase D family protein [Candidatus Acidoferrum sp.]